MWTPGYKSPSLTTPWSGDCSGHCTCSRTSRPSFPCLSLPSCVCYSHSTHLSGQWDPGTDIDPANCWKPGEDTGREESVRMNPTVGGYITMEHNNTGYITSTLQCYNLSSIHYCWLSKFISTPSVKQCSLLCQFCCIRCRYFTWFHIDLDI